MTLLPLRAEKRAGRLAQLFLVALLIALPVDSYGEELPEWPVLEGPVQFWVDIYSRYTTRQVVLHDEKYPHVVYGVLDLGGEADGGLTDYPELDREIMRLAVQRVADLLRRIDSLSDDSPRPLARDVHSGYQLLPDDEARAHAVDRVRAQRGQADRFRLGLIRSGGYLETYKTMAREAGVPEDLAYLPHVESAFESKARSGAGAAGMWQLMRPTARAYMTMDRDRDERLDPWLAAAAAYSYLRSAYDMLGSWPLAVTAYNHGPNGMRRAQRQFGDDLPAIIAGYRSRSFGFASRNFYAEFLAARRIARNPEAWFGPLQMDAHIERDVFPVPEYVEHAALAEFLEMDVESLRRLNPALSMKVWNEKGLIPAGCGLNLPPAAAARLTGGWDEIPGTARYRRLTGADYAVVRRGDSLGLIARRHGTSVQALRNLNNLHGRRYIYPGQKLKVRQSQRFVAVVATGENGTPVHVVRRGETLSLIGKRYGIDMTALIQANNIVDASRLLAGQTLVLPSAN